ncbi:MAG: lmo0937 family membrane protein [Gemmatimonadota bacterium]
MGSLSLRAALLLVLVVWLAGALFLPLHGMIHFLLAVALIMAIVDRVGR